jgi:CheY-like chemotaxis protein
MSLDETSQARKLLIVDDSKVSRMRIRAFFASHCPTWHIEEAGSGDEAIASSASFQPDFVTMDVNMPGISGFEAAELLMERHPKVHVVMLTANIQESSRVQALALNATFIKKPATEPVVREAVDYFLAAP